MKVKSSENLRLHRLATIKSVSQNDEKPNTLTIAGYASFYQNDFGVKEVDRDFEIVNVEGLDITSYQKNPILLWNHNWDKPTGQVTKLVKDAKGLYVEAEMQRLTGREDEFENVLHGNVKSFSIGFIPHEYDYLDDAIEITKAEMIELSLAPVQSNRSALFQVIGTKSLDVDNSKLKDLLEEKGDNMIIKKDAEPVVEPKEEVVVEPAKAKEEPKDVPTEPSKVEEKPEVKVEVKNEIDTAALANSLLEAQQEAQRLQEEKDAKAKEEAEQAEKDAIEAEAQKVKDALAYVLTMKEEIASTPVGELDTEKLDEFVDVITETNDVIMGKINELVQSIQESGAPE